MGHRYYLHSHGRALVVPVCRAGFVFGHRRGLVDESATGTPVSITSRADGVVAAASTYTGHSAFRPWLSICLAGIPTVPEGPQFDLQHERGGELCRQRRGRELLRGAQTRAGEPTSIPHPCRGQGRHLSLHRAVSQSTPAAETQNAATGRTTLNSTVHRNGVKPSWPSMPPKQ